MTELDKDLRRFFKKQYKATDAELNEMTSDELIEEYFLSLGDADFTVTESGQFIFKKKWGIADKGDYFYDHVRKLGKSHTGDFQRLVMYCQKERRFTKKK